MDSIWIVLGLLAFGITSPGPAFFAVLSTTLGQGHRAGVMTALGITTTNAVLSVAILAGLGSVLGRAPQWFMAVQIAGALYLIAMSARSLIKTLRARPQRSQAAAPLPHRAFRFGVFFQAANPKVWLFFLSALGTATSAGTTMATQAALVALIAAFSATWYGGVAILCGMLPLANWSRRIALISAGLTILMAFGVLGFVAKAAITP